MSQLERIVARLRRQAEEWIIRKSLQGFYSLCALAPSSSDSPMAVASRGTVN